MFLIPKQAVQSKLFKSVYDLTFFNKSARDLAIQHPFSVNLSYARRTRTDPSIDSVTEQYAKMNSKEGGPSEGLWA